MMRRGLSFGRVRRRRQEAAADTAPSKMEADASSSSSSSSGTEFAIGISVPTPTTTTTTAAAATSASKSERKPTTLGPAGFATVDAPAPAAPNTAIDTSKADRAVISTASDAVKSKLHAVSAGYYDDPFIDHFARGAEGLTAASSGGSMSTPLPVHLEGQATRTTAAAAVGAPSCKTSKGISTSPMAPSKERRHNYSRHQSNRHCQQDFFARSHSSPPDSSSSAASSFYEDGGDEGQHTFHLHEHTTPANQQDRHHHPRPHQFHQMLHSQQQHGKQLHTLQCNSHSNPLATMSPSDIHPALRGRLGITAGGEGGGRMLQRHISAGPGETRMMIPPPMNHTGGNIPRSSHGQGGQPLIRRGTHARVCAMDRALTAFLSANTGTDAKGEEHCQQRNDDVNAAYTKQVVVLGAGRDTSYLRYLDDKLIGSGSINANDVEKANGSKSQQSKKEIVRWFEVDHAGVMHQKMELLKTCPRVIINDLRKDTTGKTSYAVNISLRSEGIASSGCTRSITRRRKVTDSANDEDPMDVDQHGKDLPAQFSSRGRRTSPPYHLVGFDLRLPPSQLFEILQTQHGFDPNIPTLFLLECVLMYMPESSATRLFQEISSTCGPNAIVAIYDPILGTEGFGRVMEQNLMRAGVVAPPTTIGTDDPLCLTAHRTIDSRLDCLISCGFNTAIGCDMLAAYDTAVIGATQRARANSVEMLDEIEEWILIMRHYCFVVAGIATESKNDSARYLCAAGESSPLGFVPTKSVRRKAY